MMWALRDYLLKESDSRSFNQETWFCGEDQNGRYEGRVMIVDENLLFETRHYFYPGGRLRRITRFEDDLMLRDEEWAEDGSRQRITSYDGLGEWLWEKIFYRTGKVSLWINRDSFLFFGIPKDIIRALEAGTFHPEQLLDIRWEGVREAVLEILGASQAVPGLPVETIDRIGLNRLLRMNWRDRWGEPRMEPWCFLELHCTTTGKVTYLRVPPGFSDIMSAIAWTFGMDKENYRLEEET